MKTQSRSTLTLLVSGLAASLLFMACADDSSESSNGDGGGNSGSGAGNPGGTGTGNTGSVEYSCCINSVGYACPSNDALNQCIGFDIDGCMNGCAFDDFDCVDDCFAQWDQSTPDPSACQQNAAVTCDGPGPGPGPGSCVGDWDGTYCDVDSDCSSYNCVADKCYGSAAGNPCEVDSDCSTYNCFEGCCYGTGAGEPCDVDSDCASYNCYDNVCQ